ncbi:AAA family ATPase, partial [Spirochaetota bacterium]
KYEEINVGDITNVKYERGFSSVKLTFVIGSKEITFKSFVTETSIKKFVEKIKGITGSVSYEQKNTRNLIDNISNLFVNKTSIPGFLDKIKEMSDEVTKELFELEKDEKRLMDKSEENIKEFTRRDGEDLVNLNLLFIEAKKIYGVISEYRNFNNDENFIDEVINDIIVLSSLCSIADGKLSDEELIFISMLLMPLKPGDSNEIQEAGTNLFNFDLFPIEHKGALLKYWDTISHHIKKAKISMEGNSLKSLSYLKKYDKAKGSSHFNKMSSAFYEFSKCLMNSDGSLNEAEEERLKQINFLIYSGEIVEPVKVDGKTEVEKEETLEEVMEKINKLVGMKNIKEDINTFINLIKVQKKREERGLPVTPLSLHAVFYGPPGTGKTTIARLLGKVYKCLGLLKIGHLTETDRAGLVAGYVGHTAINVDKKVKEALDGVLFIDEAYTLSPEDAGNDFGQEAIDTILKRMEDYRERFVVIVAGYPDEMKRFINSNPGLKSRFSRYFYFDHYSPEDLILIFDIFCSEVAFNVSEAARTKLLNLLDSLFQKRDRTFGNGRLVRNIFERIIEMQANRIASISPLTDEVLCEVIEEDVPLEEDLIR